MNSDTAKALRATETLNSMLTLSSRLKAYSPFVICIVAVTTIAYLSGCRHILRGQALKVARQRIRLNMGVIKALGECWPLGKVIYKELGVIARDILCLTDRDVPLPTMPQDTPFFQSPIALDFAFDLGIDSTNFVNFDATNLHEVMV